MSDINVGIVGCGTIFPMHAYPVKNLKGVKLAAVCDIDAKRAGTWAEKLACSSFTNYTDMLQHVDVVHICTPHYLHPPMAIEALRSKKHVLTEKPMSISYDDGCRMVKTCEENGVTLGVIFQNRYNNASRLIKDTLESGSLGKVNAARMWVMWHRSDVYYDDSPWRGKWDTEGGGVIINQAIHTFDLLRWFINSPVKQVDAHIANRFHKTIEVEDMGEGAITFENGVVASFYTINYYSTDTPVYIEITCEKGTATLTGDRAEINFSDGRTVSSAQETASFDYGDDAKSYWGVAHNKQIESFYNSIKTGAPLYIDPKDALETQKMICDIYKIGRERMK